MTSRPVECRIAPWLIILVTLAVFFTLLPNSRSSILVKQTAYVAGACILALLLASAALRRIPLNRTFDGATAAAFTALAAFMTVRHFTGIRSVNGPDTILSFAALGLVTASAAMLLDAKGRTTVMWGTILPAIVMGAYAMLQWGNVALFPWDAYLGSSGRVSASLGNPNLLGGLMAALAPVGTGFVISAARGGTRVKAMLVTVILALSILSISASGTRSSLIGLLAGLLVLAVVGSRRGAPGGARRLLPVLLGAAALLFAAVIMKDRILELARADSGTGRVRLLIWEGSIGMFAARPLLGWGPGSFQIVFPAFRNPMYSILGVSHNTLHAHNEYLEILTDGGLAGALLTAAVTLLVLRSVIGRRSEGRPAFTMSEAGLLAGIAAILAEASVSVGLRWPPSAYLLALLSGILMASRSSGGKRVHPVFAPLLVLPAVLFGAWGMGHYLREFDSGHMLFLGKDVYLDKIESELGLAYNSASAWEQTGDSYRRDEALSRYQHAWVLSDSSLMWCTRCVTTNPDELGGWYGLGSAWLTRAILIEPPSPPLMRLLESSGWDGTRVDPGWARGHENAVAATRNALAAYDSLTKRAPDYAEVHNNLALTWTRLGQPAMTMSSMRRAYELHAHRRSDYIQQAFSLSPLGGGLDATHIIWTSAVDDLMDMPDDGRVDARLASMQWISGFAMMFNPEAADSMSASFAEQVSRLPGDVSRRLSEALASQAAMAAEDAVLFERAMRCDTTGLLEAAESGMSSTDAILPGHIAARAVTLTLRGDASGPGELLDIADRLFYNALPWASRWPAGGGIPVQALAAVSGAGDAEEWREPYLLCVRHALRVDNLLLNKIRIGRTDFRDGVEEEVMTGLESLWSGAGGPNAALDAGSTYPWVEGSLLALAARRADSAAVLGVSGLETELSFDLLLLSSFWWNSATFSVAHRDYLLESIDECRARISGHLGEEAARYRVASLIQSIAPVLESDLPQDMRPFLETVTRDVIEGRPLAGLAE